jgi:hypothetical protein
LGLVINTRSGWAKVFPFCRTRLKSRFLVKRNLRFTHSLYSPYCEGDWSLETRYGFMYRFTSGSSSRGCWMWRSNDGARVIAYVLEPPVRPQLTCAGENHAPLRGGGFWVDMYALLPWTSSQVNKLWLWIIP